MKTATPLTFHVESNFTGYGSRTTGATEYVGFPVRISVPAAPGRFQPADRLGIRDQSGNPVSGSVRPMHRWADGSVRVWEVWMPASLRRGERRTFELVPTRSAAPKQANQLLPVPAACTVTVLLGDGSSASQTVSFKAGKAAAGGCAFHEDEAPIELRSGAGVTLFRGMLIRKSWSWYPAVELAVRVINYAPTPDEELAVKALTLEFDLPRQQTGSDDPNQTRYTIRHATFCAENMPRLYQSDQPFDVRCDGGGTYTSDLSQLGKKQTDYAVYERGPYAASVDAWIGMTDEPEAWLLTVPEAGERYPKGWSIHGRRVKIELHPEWATPLSWRRGMALYQRVCLARLPRTTSPDDFENEAQRWLRRPLITVEADVYRAAGWRIPFRYQPERFPRTEFVIRDTWSFSWTAGTFEWGDQVGANKGSLPLHPGMTPDQGCARNLEYDFVACAAKEFARTGRPEIWKQCRASAEHMMHTDFVAVSDDQWKEGGIPHHCNRHTTGSAYTSHMWIEGLTLYYQLSGDRYALEVAKRVGDFFVKYVKERFMVVHATSREMGWALVALGAVYDLTQEKRYLQAIRTIVDFYLDAGAAHYFPYDATFAMGVGMIGMDRVRPFHRTAEVKAFILSVLDYLMARRRDAMGIFDYNFDAERQGAPWIQTHLPEALNIGYQLSGNVKYLKAAWRLYQLHEAGAILTVQNRGLTDCGYAAGYHITWTMGCFASFAAKGWLESEQFPEPGGGRASARVQPRAQRSKTPGRAPRRRQR